MAQLEFASSPPSSGTARRADPVVTEMTAERGRHLATHFLRRIAHDIASPTGVTMTVLDELGASAKPELVAMARRGLRRLLRLSEQLALVADLESGGFQPEAQPEDARDLVRTAFDAALAIDGRRDIGADLNLPDVRLPVDADRRIVSAMIREIIGNALRLASSRIAVHVTADDRAVTVAVHDDGPGFKDEIKAALGERFTPLMGARGLGLSISMAKEVLAAHGGDLRVASSHLPPGRRGGLGAAVIVTLPLASSAR